MKAFADYLQAHIRRKCRLLFRPREPVFSGLAGSFALLRMPRVPQLREKWLLEFVPVDILTDIIPFKYKTK